LQAWKRPTLNLKACQLPDLTHPIHFDEHGGPISEIFDDPFFSRKNGAAEKKHVYLDGNDLPQAWAGRDGFVIGETGFGTALIFIETLALWRTTAKRNAHLHYVTFEAYPLSRKAIAECLTSWPDRAEFATELVAALPNAWPDAGSVFCNLGNVTLEVVIGLAESTVQRHVLQADCWFLDGHSPAKNPDMWSAELMLAVGEHTKTGGTFAAYSAAGWVRRNLEAAGFAVEKRPGFGTKREMSRGVKI
jgi:tRNA U34 5-methylaminomethyl-2-thiouridine-forming methyltransferase MnmC